MDREYFLVKVMLEAGQERVQFIRSLYVYEESKIMSDIDHMEVKVIFAVVK